MNNKLIEQDKKDAIKEIKILLGDFYWNSDIGISIFVENQLEMIFNSYDTIKRL